MSSLVADTHIIVWYLTTPDKLSSNALAALDEANSAGELILVPSISIAEVVYLVERGRLPEVLLERLIEEVSRPNSGLMVAPLDLSVAYAMRQIPREIVPDMPDRIIAATAAHLGIPLVTQDRRIRQSNIQVIW